MGRVGHAGAVCQSKLYIYGGRASVEHDKTLDDLWQLDLVGDLKWKAVEAKGESSPPPALSYHSMTSDGKSTVYIFGGCTVEARSGELYAFDVDRSEWKHLTASAVETESGAQPTARGGPAVVYASDGIHVLFGYNGKEELADHWVWNEKGQNWIEIKSELRPPARSVTDAVYLAQVGAQGSIFVFGGEYTPSKLGHDGAGEYHSDAWLYDIAEGYWKTVADDGKGDGVPKARGWFNTVALQDGKSALIFGGFDGEARINDVHVWTAV